MTYCQQVMLAREYVGIRITRKQKILNKVISMIVGQHTIVQLYLINRYSSSRVAFNGRIVFFWIDSTNTFLSTALAFCVDSAIVCFFFMIFKF